MSTKANCPGCNRHITPEERSAALENKLKRPICVYCADKTVAFLQRQILPMLNAALKRLEEIEKGEGDVHG